MIAAPVQFLDFWDSARKFFVAVHEGAALGCLTSALAAADLLVDGQLRWRGGHAVDPDQQTAAGQVVAALPADPGERARALQHAITGTQQ